MATEDLTAASRRGLSLSDLPYRHSNSLREGGKTKSKQNASLKPLDTRKNTRTRIDESVVVNLNKAADSQKRYLGRQPMF